MDSIYKDPTDIPQPDELQKLQTKVMQKHSMLLFQFCTLLSAYLLVHHVEKLLQNTTFETAEARLERIKSDCLGLYVVRYDHIIATYKEEEDQNPEEEEEQDEQNKETEQQDEETKLRNVKIEQQNEEAEQDEETEQQDVETEQQDEETEQQEEGDAKTTDVNDIPDQEHQESKPACRLGKEPAAKKQKTNP